MNCFVHATEVAVGICKSCGKGVCRSCAIQVNRGLACSENCKPFAEGLTRWQSVAIRNVGLASSQRLAQPLLAFILLGAGTYFFASYGYGPTVWMCFGAGAVFALTSLMSWLRFRPSHRNDK